MKLHRPRHPWRLAFLSVVAAWVAIAGWNQLKPLPPGVHVSAIESLEEASATPSRSYRVNLNVLAMIALFTGGFLVFSAQALEAARRRGEHALLRVLGLTRRQGERDWRPVGTWTNSGCSYWGTSGSRWGNGWSPSAPGRAAERARS